MTPARRLTAALLGLLALVVIGYFAKDLGGSSDPAPTTSSTSTRTVATGGSSVAGQTGGQAAKVPGAGSGMAVKELSGLPAEAVSTWQLIERGGPFPYPRNDGVTFQNREKRLPAKSGDYYREYTVPTPGSPDRGARRIVTGSSSEVYYTGDHYSTFVVVDVSR
ncbi:ribonuclease domain-containing protein [Actinosynnema sp. NPDC047251]|uniref:Putative secreted protein n=1 Tax=Saccharothrix espanaensis (strain ATCC 51144 / DSM 44229 / JCM 9112 / NBRC 15066 / NRRL 15764) TaxID=1179773 RepID=K0JX41_SACES|nr:ribonuclease domain-containing protein [Saccharothrix espanaensis]CCH28793.1 putative secreted protein [Saccharothrix espanaensis DSM 44229]